MGALADYIEEKRIQLVEKRIQLEQEKIQKGRREALKFATELADDKGQLSLKALEEKN